MAMTKTYGFDAATGLLKRDVAQAAVTADAYIGTQLDQGAATLTDMVAVINIEAIDIADSDETYTFEIVLSNASNRSDGVVVAKLTLGDAAAIARHTVDTAAGATYHIPFRTEFNGVAYRYVDLYLDVAGTSPSITFNAFVTAEDT